MPPDRQKARGGSRRPETTNDLLPTVTRNSQPRNCTPPTIAALPHIFEGPCSLGDDVTEPSTWDSPDGTTSVWYMGEGDFRVQTAADHHRAARLRRMTRIEFSGECVAGGPFMQLFDMDRRKLRTEAMRKLLWRGVGGAPGPSMDADDFKREEVTELATSTSAGS